MTTLKIPVIVDEVFREDEHYFYVLNSTGGVDKYSKSLYAPVYGIKESERRMNNGKDVQSSM